MTGALAHFGPRRRVYPSFFAKAFQRELAYKFEYFIGVFNGLLFMFIFTSLWEAVYAGPTAATGGTAFTREGIITYAVYAMLVRISMTQEESGIPAKVRSGEIAMDMIKPVNYMLMTLAETGGGTLFHWVTRVAPIFAVALFAFDAWPPSDPLNWLMLGVSWVFGYLIFFYLNFAFALLAFWFVETFSFQLMKFGLFTLFAGGIVPIDFFPDWLQPVIAFLPFPSIIYVPTALFIGHIPAAEAGSLIGVQVAWTVGLGLLCRVMWGMGQRKLIVQGG
ncbi:MAG: ABC-2 family transporter protein [Nitrospinae bacterium]|nr:ABC-2 family transporter protein [Nitrospinota bacterium]